MHMSSSVVALGSMFTMAVAVSSRGVLEFPDSVPMEKRQPTGAAYDCHSDCGKTTSPFFQNDLTVSDGGVAQVSLSVVPVRMDIVTTRSGSVSSTSVLPVLTSSISGFTTVIALARPPRPVDLMPPRRLSMAARRRPALPQSPPSLPAP